MPEKEYNPQEPVAVTLTREQWQMVQSSVLHCADTYHNRAYWWATCCDDKKEGRTNAAQYKQAAERAEAILEIIQDTLNPAPPKETE